MFPAVQGDVSVDMGDEDGEATGHLFHESIVVFKAWINKTMLTHTFFTMFSVGFH